MHATYTPPAGQTVCPHCAAAVPLALMCAAVDWFSLWLTCPACRQPWKETRFADGTTTRFWSPVRPRVSA